MQLSCPRVGGAHQHEHPGSTGSGRVDQRLKRLAAEQRIRCHRVSLKAFHAAEQRWGLPEESLPVRSGRHRHIAALGIGDDQQAVLARAARDIVERCPTRGAEALEAGHLELDCDAVLSGGFDRERAMNRHRKRRARRRWSRRIACASRELDGAWPQASWIGVEPQHKLRAAGFDAPSDSVAEALDRRGVQARLPDLLARSVVL